MTRLSGLFRSHPNSGCPKRSLVKLFLLSATAVLSSDALANRFGVSGFSNATGSNRMTCAQSGCHSGSDYNSSLSFQGETTVTPGSTNEISVILSFTSPAGVSGPVAHGKIVLI